MSEAAPVVRFPALAAVSGLKHGFTARVPGLDVTFEREIALLRLAESHRAALASLGLKGHKLITATQVHGAEVAVVSSNDTPPIADVDGLITADPSVCLGIHVADCGPVFIVDPVRRIAGLLHSGRKGTELGITSVAIRLMQERFGSLPADLIVQLGPCIRQPLYEVDFAGEIVSQAKSCGVHEVHDCGVCTGSDVSQYYSYRVEKGKTGRMLALLALS